MRSSTIMKWMEEQESVIVFDVDGVLGAFEFGKHCHNGCLDEEWDEYIKEKNPYDTIRPIKSIQCWIQKYKDPSHVFVCAASGSDLEDKQKIGFVLNHYDIPESNIYMVRSKLDKLNILNEIHEKPFPGLDSSRIIMMDDTIKTLTFIQENSGYSTAHISSFIK